jgi:hypothetical protein
MGLFIPVDLQTYEQHCQFGQKMGTIAYIQVIKKGAF